LHNLLTSLAIAEKSLNVKIECELVEQDIEAITLHNKSNLHYWFAQTNWQLISDTRNWIIQRAKLASSDRPL